jgi:TRAP-type C4-dicarboxylate transport system substrate-binding protein
MMEKVSENMKETNFKGIGTPGFGHKQVVTKKEISRPDWLQEILIHG